MIEENEAYLVLDIGGTFIKSVVLNKRGDILKGSAFRVLSHSSKSKELIFQSISECISNGLLLIDSVKKTLKGIGIAIPGPFDYKTGTFLMEHKFQSVYGENLKQLIYNIPNIDKHIPICCVHDANAVLLGEQWKGRAQPYKNSAVVTLGTGIGFAFSQNTIVQCTPLCLPSITIYETPYKNGILEDYVSQRGILEIYKEFCKKNVLENITVFDIGKQADNEDNASIKTFGRAAEILSESIVGILQQKEIECLLLGGQISRSYRHMEEILKERLSGLKTLKQISPVDSIDHAAFYGILWKLLKQ
ncbi:ROK family protein [Parabacteroides sp. Marseille-P3160]|uniref:ROK family protein n=1 Tax=Parabacteroides sp. Marseille-P3160 TaxID=1917887 RepID=UPI0009BC32F4|nr:ROK family protein [Parabacteroides sp. Marseille-P3160]